MILKDDLEGKLEGDQLEYLEGLMDSTAKADSLVSDLLDLSSVGRQSVPTDYIHVGVFLKEICDEFAFPQSVVIEMPDDWPSIEVERTLFRMVFQNLISNAAKFNESSSKRIELGGS